MERLLNINRPEGFPLCAETLGVLNRNAEMLASWLKWLPLKNRQAVLFRDKDYLVVCQGMQNRIVKVGAISAQDFSRCKVTFTSENGSVTDSSGNVTTDVWTMETAFIVDEISTPLQWDVLNFESVFETRLWNDCLDAFVSGLSGSAISDGSLISLLALYGQDNILRDNGCRTQIRLELEYSIRAKLSSVLVIPFPAVCPDGVRLDADLEDMATSEHYPVRACVQDGALHVDIGRCLRDENIFTPSRPDQWIQCHGIIRINKEVLL